MASSNTPPGGNPYRRQSYMRPYDPIPPPNQNAVESARKLYQAIAAAFPDFVADFEDKWGKWQHPQPGEFGRPWGPTTPKRDSDEFFYLVDLGPKIIPLIVHKLADESEGFYFFNVHPYNELEKDKHYLVDPDDVINYMTLQRQARLIVDMNYERNTLVEARIAAWKAHFERAPADGSLNHYGNCQECYDLFALGGSIISHIMAEYKKREGTLPWNELLHAIVHGVENTAGLENVDRDEQYTAWAEWFEKLNHDEAPRWVDGKWVSSGPPVGEVADDV